MSKPFRLCPDLNELHSYERLNYVLGQVLGVKDFQQEQVYFLHKARLHNRSLHGYGTVWGLDVRTEVTDEDIEIQVAPGFALDTQGREVWVDALQCAKLNAWLNAAVEEGSETSNRETLTPIAEGSSTLAVYVTLCYRPCKTNAQPILGNPCRADSGEEGVIQYTRTRDDFELQLRSQPPLQHEERWVRAIADLLALIEVDAEADDLTGEEQTALKQILRDSLDEPTIIDGLETITVPEDQAENILRELLRYWVTNTRPNLDLLHNPVLRILEKIEVNAEAEALESDALATQLADFTDVLDSYIETKTLTAIDALIPVTVSPETSAALRRGILQYWSSKPESCKTNEDDCILLASVQFELATDDNVNINTLVVDFLQRPYLLHTRLLQELVLRGLNRRQSPTNEPGDAAEITIGTVTTGAPGTNAQVSNSGTSTNAVFDFVIPRGNSGDAATVTVGNVQTGAPGSAVTITNSGDTTNAILDFTIPRGAPGSGGTLTETFDQIVVRPNDMLPFNNPNNPLVIANADIASGYPVMQFDEDGRGIATFSVLRPGNLPRNFRSNPLFFLRLYCSVDVPQTVSWQITWRWVRSLGPIIQSAPFNEFPDFRPGRPESETQLLPVQSTNIISTNMSFLEEQHLHISDVIPLRALIDAPADYLVVYLSPQRLESRLYLLMAELRWQV